MFPSPTGYMYTHKFGQNWPSSTREEVVNRQWMVDIAEFSFDMQKLKKF